MIIVSQNRMKITTLQDAEVLYEPEFLVDNMPPVDRWVVFVNDDVYAEYRTEEKAIKAFQEIIDAYQHCNDIYEMPEE